MLAGALGTSGLLLLYHSMTKGLMSIATPVSALLAAVLPVVIGSFIEGRPGLLIFVGFVFALAAVWLISQSSGRNPGLADASYRPEAALLAGVGFGLYFVLMHGATRHATFWPMVASRLGGILIIAFYMTLSRETWKVEGAPGQHDRSEWHCWISAAICSSSSLGRPAGLDIASVLSSLYPGSTVILAWVFLRERLSRTQWMGIVAALIAIVLITL